MLYVAAASYATADAGVLVALSPDGSGPDIDAAEFLAIPTVAFLDRNADGLYDRFDPALDFRILDVRLESGGVIIIDFASIPGASYQLTASSALDEPFVEFGNPPLTAGNLDGVLSQTNMIHPSAGQKFFRLRLVTP